MKTPSKDDLVTLESRFMSASKFFDAKLMEHTALILVSDPQTRERARLDVMYAVEAMLDRHEEYASASLLAAGVDPYTRHIGPDLRF